MNNLEQKTTMYSVYLPHKYVNCNDRVNLLFGWCVDELATGHTHTPHFCIIYVQYDFFVFRTEFDILALHFLAVQQKNMLYTEKMEWDLPLFYYLAGGKFCCHP